MSISSSTLFFLTKSSPETSPESSSSSPLTANTANTDAKSAAAAKAEAAKAAAADKAEATKAAAAAKAEATKTAAANKAAADAKDAEKQILIDALTKAIEDEKKILAKRKTLEDELKRVRTPPFEFGCGLARQFRAPLSADCKIFYEGGENMDKILSELRKLYNDFMMTYGKKNNINVNLSDSNESQFEIIKNKLDTESNKI
jgi:hypothetical protein